MKKLFYFLLILICKANIAQDIAIDSVVNENSDNYGTIKVKEDDNYNESYINNVDPSIVRYVFNNYKNAENIQWIVDETGTEVSFDDQQRKVLLVYDKNGILLMKRLNYKEEMLDKRIAGYARKKAGKEYQINLVTELNYNGKLIYEICLESSDRLCFVKITGERSRGFDPPVITKIITKA